MEKELDTHPPQSHFTSNALIMLHFNFFCVYDIIKDAVMAAAGRINKCTMN